LGAVNFLTALLHFPHKVKSNSNWLESHWFYSNPFVTDGSTENWTQDRLLCHLQQVLPSQRRFLQGWKGMLLLFVPQKFWGLWGNTSTHIRKQQTLAKIRRPGWICIDELCKRTWVISKRFIRYFDPLVFGISLVFLQ
jgi:hypothetical protein